MVHHIIEDVLRNSVLITGLVVIMMMMIESLNIESGGRFLNRLKGSHSGQILLSAFLGSIPGCMGGFASVSLYTHGLISFGALVAMLVASSGDEAFVMLAIMPKKALWIFLLLFVIAVVSGFLTDYLHKCLHSDEHKERCHCGDRMHCDAHFEVHEADTCSHREADMEEHRHSRHLTWKRALMFIGVAVFVGALATGLLEHEHGGLEEETVTGGINLLSEDWMNIMFAGLSVLMLGVLAFASDHFVEEHLWHHIVKKHLPGIFCWTAGALALITVLLNYFDISGWISDNTAIMVILAALVGIIPESGPHLLFVTLYASGIVPLPVLLASCISQDGHASLPLLAESTKSFARAKLINFALATAVGFAGMLFL